MPQIILEINLEVARPNLFQAIVAKQYDMNTRYLKVTFVNNGEKIPLDTARTVVINALRSDGQADSFFGVVNDDNTATVPLHSWMLEREGSVQCDVSIIDEASSKKLTSTNFSLMVEKAAFGGSDVSEDPQYDVLLSLIKQVEEIETVSMEEVQEAIKGSAYNIDFPGVLAGTDNLGATVENLENLYMGVDGRLGTVETDMAVYGGELMNTVKKDEIEHNFNPSGGENPISNSALSEAYFVLEDNINALTANAQKWQTVLNTTLTAADAGKDDILIPIPQDKIDALADAREIRLVLSFPVVEEYAANKFYITVLLRDASNQAYNRTLAGSYNTAGSANKTYHTLASIFISGFRENSSYPKTYHSIFHQPNIHYNAPGNTNVAAKQIMGGYPSKTVMRNNPPYIELKATTDTIKFNEGTRLFVEALA